MRCLVLADPFAFLLSLFCTSTCSVQFNCVLSFCFFVAYVVWSSCSGIYGIDYIAEMFFIFGVWGSSFPFRSFKV